MGHVRNCARCGADHHDLTWEQLDRPIIDDDGTTWTHWTPCPTNGQPILMRDDGHASLVTENAVDAD